MKIWFKAIRPWSYTAAFIPISLGAALAFVEGHWNPALYVWTLIAGLLIQAGTNMYNTYGDYKAGVDTEGTAVKRSPLVRGEISPKVMQAAALGSFAFSGAIGLYLAYICGWPILAVGVLGMLGGYGYTGGWAPYKYKGLGAPFVFFLMGPLMVWPSYYIQAGHGSWTPVWVSLPISLLVTAILHANEIRDHEADRGSGVVTFSLRLGYERSIKFYYILNYGAYVALVALTILRISPLPALLPFILLPYVVKTVLQAKEGSEGQHEKLLWLMVASGNIHFLFGVLQIIGIILTLLPFHFH